LLPLLLLLLLGSLVVVTLVVRVLPGVVVVWGCKVEAIRRVLTAALKAEGKCVWFLWLQ
jgi:hypothetical protein